MVTLSPAEQRVTVLIAEFAGAWRRTLELAVELGDALNDLKGELGHGRWLPWIDANFPLGRRMAQNFMDLSANAQQVAYLPAGTGIREALEWLQAQRRDLRGPRALPEPVESEPVPLLRFSQVDLPSATIVSAILRVAFPDALTALDVTYGSGAFWDGSAHVKVTAHDADPDRAPNGVMDFTHLVYGSNAFDVVTFDPPHLADAGAESIMGKRFGTYSSAALRIAITSGAREAWRVGRLGIIAKVTDHVHGQEYQEESALVRRALDNPTPYETVHQVRSGALIDPSWEEQYSAYNNGSTYLIFRKGDQKHVRRRA